MKLRYENGWLEIDLNSRGNNFIPLVKCSERNADEIIYQCDCRMAGELYEVIECILDENVREED